VKAARMKSTLMVVLKQEALSVMAVPAAKGNIYYRILAAAACLHSYTYDEDYLTAGDQPV
jgi:hypothetical protein